MKMIGNEEVKMKEFVLILSKKVFSLAKRKGIIKKSNDGYRFCGVRVEEMNGF